MVGAHFFDGIQIEHTQSMAIYLSKIYFIDRPLSCLSFTKNMNQFDITKSGNKSYEKNKLFISNSINSSKDLNISKYY